MHIERATGRTKPAALLSWAVLVLAALVLLAPALAQTPDPAANAKPLAETVFVTRTDTIRDTVHAPAPSLPVSLHVNQILLAVLTAIVGVVTLALAFATVFAFFDRRALKKDYLDEAEKAKVRFKAELNLQMYNLQQTRTEMQEWFGKRKQLKKAELESFCKEQKSTVNTTIAQAKHNYEVSLAELKENSGVANVSTPPTPEARKDLDRFSESLEQVKTEEEYTAEDWFYKGVREYDHGEYGNAAASFARATELESNNANAFNNWGNALVGLYRRVPEDEQTGILAEARRVLEEADKLKPGSVDYNLACVAALEGKPELAFKKLEAALKADNVTVEHAEQDEDLKSLHSNPRWKPLMDKYRKPRKLDA